jgi:branched-chain amino acid aminotransferase
MNLSNERLSIPAIDENTAMNAIRTLVSLDKEWIPEAKDTSLYIRPFIIATDPYLGIKASDTYKFIIILSPVGCYYPEGLNPVKIFVEYNYSRVAKGMGTAKTPGNYAASIKAQIEAKNMGFTQVLWLDSFERKYVEEVGSMNVFFKIGDEVITPALNGNILDGITRRSVIELLNEWDIKCTERQISVDEIHEAAQNGSLKEAFGTGTAAVISPIGELMMKNGEVKVNDGKTGGLSIKLYDTLTKIQMGVIKDKLGWVMEI